MFAFTVRFQLNARSLWADFQFERFVLPFAFNSNALALVFELNFGVFAFNSRRSL